MSQHDTDSRAPSRERAIWLSARRPRRRRTDRRVERRVRRAVRAAVRRPTSPSRLLLCCSYLASRVGSHGPTRQRRASAEPRARRSAIGAPTSTSAYRSPRRAPRAPRRARRRAPTDLAIAPASLLLVLTARVGSHEPNENDERAPSCKRVVQLSARRPRRRRADRRVERRVRRAVRAAARRPTSPSHLVLCCSYHGERRARD